MPFCTRRLEFDYAHRVLEHESKCKYLHGHRGVIEVTVRAPELDKLGRVVDFGCIKQILGGWIDSNWDHNAIFHQDDPILQHEAGPVNLVGRDPYILPVNPTAENLADAFLKVADKLLQAHNPDLNVFEVVFYETPNCWSSVKW